MSTRRAIKTVLEHGMMWSGVPRRGLNAHRADTLVLAYHNIVPAGEPASGDQPLHLPQQVFAEQLDQLVRTHDVVPLVEVLQPAAPGRVRPRAAITFDDAYRGALTAGLAELAARGLPATVFVPPGQLGNSGFWWDLLAGSASGLEPSVRAQALEQHRGDGVAVLSWAHGRGDMCSAVPDHACCITPEALHTALAYDGLTLAAHTWTHANLTRVDRAALRQELWAPLEWLSRFGDRGLPYISYPYGLVDEHVQTAAREAGYTAGFMISGGWVTERTRREHLALPRLDVPCGVSAAGFALRTAGVIAH